MIRLVNRLIQKPFGHLAFLTLKLLFLLQPDQSAEFQALSDQIDSLLRVLIHDLLPVALRVVL